MVEAGRLARVIGSVRLAVGAGLIAFPERAGGVDAASRMLVRTIGIRDVVLGVGTLWAGPAARGGWVRAGIGSDVADAALATRSARDLGRGAVIAALIPLPVIVAGIEQRRRERTGA